MITLYTKMKDIKKNENFIQCVDLAFDKFIYSLNISESDKRFMEIIDKAEYAGNGYIVTPFGRTEIQNLSRVYKFITIQRQIRSRSLLRFFFLLKK